MSSSEDSTAAAASATSATSTASAASVTKFDPAKSQASPATLAKFLVDEIDEDVTSVPGIGPAAKKLLATGSADDPAITTTYQLIGKFLMLRSEGMTSKEHCDAMFDWLCGKGIRAHRSGIVVAIAEKTNTMIPGIYEL